MRRVYWATGLFGICFVAIAVISSQLNRFAIGQDGRPRNGSADELGPPSDPPGDTDEGDDPPFRGRRPLPGDGPPRRGRGPGGPPGEMREERKVVKQFDKDGDDRLNKEERLAAREWLKKESAGQPGSGPFRGGPGGGRRGPEGFLAEVAINALDVNEDGKVSQDELVTGTEKFFALADSDKNGSLSVNEFSENLDPMSSRPNGDGPERKRGGREGRRQRPRGNQRPVGFGPGSFLSEAIVKRADANNDKLVSQDELKSAAERLFAEGDKEKSHSLDQQGVSAAIALLSPERRGPGPRGFGRRGEDEPVKPGPKLRAEDVAAVSDAPLYDESVLRTLFLEFEDADWEQELADFNNTDVEVPATLIVDGKRYDNVGVHFRGMSSYFAVGAGHKRSLNISLDFVDEKQRLYGYKTLNLLNAHEDGSFMHTVLYSKIARDYITAPKANFVKLAINGESWGIYSNAQQFDKVFLSESFPTSKGVRWKVAGSPGGRGGLEYLGDDIEEYKQIYEMKTNDGDKAWKSLIELCRTLSETPDEELEAKLQPILDVDGALWFLALENVLINSDGYWIRASDYSLYRDENGKFHVIPHDMNEAFQPAMGPGTFGGRGSGNALHLDPLVAVDDESKPLRSRLLAVPAFKAKYLDHVRVIADTWLDWNKLGPVVESYRSLIEHELELDTRKLSSIDEFRESVSDDAGKKSNESDRNLSLRNFAEQRRDFLLKHSAMKTTN